MERRKEILALFFAVALFSCTDATGPREDPNPPVDAATFSCGRWSPDRPPVAFALIDIHFGQRTLDDPVDRPSAESLARIVALGGTVVYNFNVPMARAILAIDAVPDLSANYVDIVTNMAAFVVRVVVRMDTPLTAEDRTFLESVGARDIREGMFAVSAMVPDAAIPAIRAYRTVDYLLADVIACPTQPAMRAAE